MAGCGVLQGFDCIRAGFTALGCGYFNPKKCFGAASSIDSFSSDVAGLAKLQGYFLSAGLFRGFQ